MRIIFPQELQEQIEREAQDSGVSKQKRLQEIIDYYYSKETEEDRSRLTALALMENQLRDEKEKYNNLYEEHEWLKGEYALATTKLLPAAEKTMTPWWLRLRKKLFGF
jgi:predicted nucleotidyltransferase